MRLPRYFSRQIDCVPEMFARVLRRMTTLLEAGLIDGSFAAFSARRSAPEPSAKDERSVFGGTPRRCDRIVGDRLRT